jgi:hypothetical protein
VVVDGKVTLRVRRVTSRRNKNGSVKVWKISERKVRTRIATQGEGGDTHLVVGGV